MTEAIGRYKCLKTVGKGGMGEVLLAYDPVCERQVALKRIRADLSEKSSIKARFFREAMITAELTHPGIISIYSIHQEENELYYTMPYVEGETLRTILRKKEEAIPALLPIFKILCQTVAYAHSKGVIHRDLKPENILVGTFGEVIILDWGLAEKIDDPGPKLEVPGKLVGTVAYMAPEYALGQSASLQTDLYALGVILYQILTLHLPFDRASIKEFQKTHQHEKLHDPEEVAPYRDVPPRLSRMVKKCLEKDPENRYQSVDELIHDLLSHMEGRSEWFESGKLDPKQKKHWEFQENVLISKHIAVTRATESADWVSIMVSKSAFAENTRFETRIRIGEEGEGIGFLLSVPGATERESPLEGYCLWIGSDLTPATQLFRNTVEVMHEPDVCLERGKWHTLTVEKVDHNIHFYLDGELQITYLSYLPLFGTHIGLLARDANFEMEPIVVSSGSQNLQVSCLSVPDAFLASKDYKRALAEYHRIAYSFPGHAEGREALFRAGVTLLEQARTARTEKKAQEYYTLALEEFAKLHKTPGAPLEYLGKALVYHSLRDRAEEIKCLELGLRRYRKHPLIDAIQEQIIYRMHEASQTDRRSAYQLILIVLRLLPNVVKSGDSNRLFRHLVSNWELLPFLESAIDPSLLGKEKSSEIRFAIPLAFWQGSPYILLELFQDLEGEDQVALGDVLYALVELGSYGLAQKLLDELDEKPPFIEPLIVCHTHSLRKALELFFETEHIDLGIAPFRTLSYLLQYALRTDQEELVHESAARVLDLPLSREDRILLDAFRIWAYLKQENWEAAGVIFETYPLELINQEGTILHSLYGCYLYATEGEEIAHIHFAGVTDTPFPRSWALLGHELTNKITESVNWYSTSFMFERRRLYRQLTLYHRCAGHPDLEAYYRHLEREEYIYVM